MKKLMVLTLALVVGYGQVNAQKSKKVKEILIEFETTEGVMLVKLYNQTPLHRDNMVKLVKEGYYDGLLFHRVIKSFMIQGGDPDSRNAKPGQMLGQGGPGYTVPAEIIDSLIHKKGALAAARMGDQVNPTKASSGSQFYIVQGRPFNENELKSMEARSGIKYTDAQKQLYATLGGVPHLDGGYTVFGELVTGFDVLDKIGNTQTGAGDRPVKEMKIIKAKILD
ncbi:MAG: peptidylprolyl isomerase [Sphingobacteriaceae bacterium]|nr:peptidylprolyl isomerase [Sphingobacteriaceae bacterium]